MQLDFLKIFISINNLITASEKIGKGNLDTKVPELKADREMELLNKNFNLMIDRLKNQQEKLLTLNVMKHGKMLQEN